MIKTLTNEQMRVCDQNTIQKHGVPSLELMERAGTAMAEEIIRILEKNEYSSVLVVCGGGNNGGDGFVLARILFDRQYTVKVLSVAEKYSLDCIVKKLKYKGEILSNAPVEKYDVIVDCLFGTGLSRNVEEPEKSLVEYMNNSESYVVSADIPSGLDGDNGRAMGVAVRADMTIAIQAVKTGLLLGDGKDYSGEIRVVDIGIDTSVYENVCVKIAENSDIAPMFAKRKSNTHKGSYGKIAIVAGATAYSGAALLSTAAALRGGAGFTQLCVPKMLFQAFMGKYPEAILTCMSGESEHVFDEENLRQLLSGNCIAIGMGCGVSEELYRMIDYLLKNFKGGKILIDADGLNSVAKFGVDCLKDKVAEVLITPHVKEFSKLCGKSMKEISSAPIELAEYFAKEYGVPVYLKGNVSILTDGDHTYFNTRGCAALAKGGSGDILSGLIGSIAAQGHTFLDSALAGGYLMGASAELCAKELSEYAVTGSDIIENIPKAILSLTEDAEEERKEQEKYPSDEVIDGVERE